MQTVQKIIKLNDKKVVREFFPGNAWCCYKIYCSHLVGERVINEVIQPLIRSYKKNEKDLIWFFIRYEDPDHHIRLRIKSPKIGIITRQLNKLLQPLIDEGFIFSIQLDTYRREIERYQENNMELSEQLFSYDSTSMVEALSVINKLEDENSRWKVALFSIDCLLNDFDLDVFERMELMEDSYKFFMPEYVNISSKEAQKSFKSSIDAKLRLNSSFLDEIIRLKKTDSLNEFVLIFEKRSENLINIVHEIKKNITNKERLIILLRDYIHMSLNRIFPSNARMHELVLYYFMYKTYYSNYNRVKQSKINCLKSSL
jgi:thiopeptide-type bacteriocin biosynthesis protein